MGREGLAWEADGKLVISVGCNGIQNLTNPWSKFRPAPHEEHKLVFSCFPPFFSLVYAGAQFPVERAAFDLWNTTLAQCWGSEVWKPLQASPHKIVLTFSNWREWEGKAWLMCSVWGLMVLAVILTSAEKGVFHVTAAVIPKEKWRWWYSSGTVSVQKLGTC